MKLLHENKWNELTWYNEKSNIWIFINDIIKHWNIIQNMLWLHNWNIYLSINDLWNKEWMLYQCDYLNYIAIIQIDINSFNENLETWSIKDVLSILIHEIAHIFTTWTIFQFMEDENIENCLWKYTHALYLKNYKIINEQLTTILWDSILDMYSEKYLNS